ncbi:MAG: hypothetical protein L3J71_00135 [Victivallaceae bacterium]|nr:hypothetical protein [Victivallaceae bacterium]
MSETIVKDGIHAMIDREDMDRFAIKWRDAYAMVPDAPLVQKTFGLWMCIDKWYTDGLPEDSDLNQLFMLEPSGQHLLKEIGWCEAAFQPQFESVIIEDRGDTEVVQDFAGRHVLYFKNRRNGFMPEYIDHPVKDWQTWEDNVKWRLMANTPGRFDYLTEAMPAAIADAKRGLMMTQRLIGGYMYLRSLFGPEDIMYKVFDEPELIHDCMKAWLELTDRSIAEHQKYVTLDELFMAEDICYNNGPLISPDMIGEFLMPYYQQLVANVKSRQIDKQRKLYIQIDTDGKCMPVIDVYLEGIGMDMMSPFEVASGCDVVAVAQAYPNLVMSGGFDKRIMAQGKAAIDREVERIFPVMRDRGGYIPTCDHGVPEEVSVENYLHYRKRCIEYGN